MQIDKFRSSPIGGLTSISGTDGRTGREYNHMAYVPDPLGGDPELSTATWTEVAQASFALGKLNQASRQIPAPDLLRRPSIRREAQSTSALEGTFAAIDDVLAADLASDESPRSLEMTEVLNYVVAAERGFSALADGYPISVTLLCQLHGTLVAETRADGEQAGRVRRIQVAIGGGLSIEEARFVPPPPGVALEADLRNLMDWVNASPPRVGQPVIAAAMTHYQFETLHPFNDGNGRIGRLLIALQLIQSEVVSEPLLAVSPWFEARKDEYIDQMAALSASGNWDPWVRFFATGIKDSAFDTTRRIDELLDTRERYVEVVRLNNLRGVARDIVDLLIGFPIITVPQLVKRTSATFPTVNSAIQKLVSLGILTPMGGTPRRFVAMDVFRAVR